MLIHAPLVPTVQLYRLERFNECKTVYTDLIRNSQDEYEEERKTNLAAVVASISQWENSPLVTFRFLVGIAAELTTLFLQSAVLF